MMSSKKLKPRDADDGRVLYLTRFAQNLAIEPYSEELMRLLCRNFYTTRHKPIDDPSLGYRLSPSFFPLVFLGTDFLERRVLEVYAGFTFMVCEMLQRHGYRLIWKAPPPEPLPPPDVKRLQQFDPIDRPVIAAVNSLNRALIRYRKGQVSPPRLIAQIAEAWPTKRIMVWVIRSQEAKRLKWQLDAYYHDVPAHYSGCCPSRRFRVVVSTIGQLGAPQVEIEKRDIVIALHAGELVRSSEARQALRLAWKGKLFGFLPDHEILAPYDRDWLTALFGPKPVSVPAHGREYRPVDVCFTRIAGGPAITSVADAFDLKRQGIWLHPVRNRRIAELASQLQQHDDSRLPDDCRELFRLASDSINSGRMAILVDSVEHALALAKLLPKWPVVVDRDYQDGGLRQQQQHQLTAGSQPHVRTQQNVIVTQAGLKRAGTFDILLRADGGTDLPALPQKLATVPTAKHLPRMLLIDMADKHHPQLRKWTRYRRDAYMAAQWNVVGTQRQTELDHFLSTRPKVVLT